MVTIEEVGGWSTKASGSLLLEIASWGFWRLGSEFSSAGASFWEERLNFPIHNLQRKEVCSAKGQDSFPLRHNSGHTRIICKSALGTVPLPISHP